jgi:diguanylate cyclase (GGDEF)-like protein
MPSVDDAASVAQPEAFRALLQGIGVIAGLTHVAFGLLFYRAGVDLLAYVNILSVLSYVWVVVLARQGHAEKAWAVIVLEVLLHAMLAVAVIGWESGFHYYILLVIPVSVVSSIRPMWLKAAVTLGVMGTYLAMAVALRHTAPPYALTPEVLDGLHYFNVAGMMLIMLFLAVYYYHLINTAEGSLREMATTDPLTRLRNRRSISEIIRIEHKRVERDQQILSFILCDLDHFKQINDTHGHDMGDTVLQAVSTALTSGVRDIDYLARWGGEEFLVVLPHTDLAGAMLVAERLRSGVADLALTCGGTPVPVTLTLGVATMVPGETVGQVISRADAALYQGKHAGRNRAMASGQATLSQVT